MAIMQIHPCWLAKFYCKHVLADYTDAFGLQEKCYSLLSGITL